MLYLKDDATKQECSPNKSWRKYIIENIDNWKTYLEESDFDISIEQLMIVRGFVKTSSWEAVAWTQSTGSHTFSIAASAAGHAGVNGSISNTHETRTTPVYRRWPTTSIASNQLQDAQQSLLHDQTIFLRYYCIRRRNWFQMWLEKTKIDAGAGYHNLPPPSPGAGSGVVAYVESDAQPEVYPSF